MAAANNVPKPGDRFNPYKRLRQIMVPLGMVECGCFSPAALVVYGRLQFFKGKDSDSCIVSREKLAGMLNLSVPKIDRAVAELRKGGVLKTEKRGRGAEAEYIFLYSHILGDSAPAQSQDVHQPQVETGAKQGSDSAYVQSQVGLDSAYLKNQEPHGYAYMQSQDPVDSAKPTPLTLQNRSVDSAKPALHIRRKKY
jgi:hypothetical protein